MAVKRSALAIARSRPAVQVSPVAGWWTHPASARHAPGTVGSPATRATLTA